VAIITTKTANLEETQKKCFIANDRIYLWFFYGWQRKEIGRNSPKLEPFGQKLLAFVGLLSSQSLSLWPTVKLVLVAAAVYRWQKGFTWPSQVLRLGPPKLGRFALALGSAEASCRSSSSLYSGERRFVGATHGLWCCCTVKNNG